MPQRRPVKKIRAAARHFVKVSSDLQEIADAFEVTPSTVRNWSKTVEWQKTLDRLGYQGDGAFANPTRDTERERGAELENVRAVYFEVLKAYDLIGESPRKLTRLVSEKTGVEQRTVYRWAKRYGWREAYEKAKKENHE